MVTYVYKALWLCLLWVCFVCAHLFFLKTFLYWHVWWLDVLMHIVGGVLVVTTALYLRQSKIFPRYSALGISHPLWVLITFAVVWEIFKYAIATELLPHYWFDTMLDLVVGIGGGLLAYSLLLSRTID